MLTALGVERHTVGRCHEQLTNVCCQPRLPEECLKLNIYLIP